MRVVVVVVVEEGQTQTPPRACSEPTTNIQVEAKGCMNDGVVVVVISSSNAFVAGFVHSQ